MPDKDKPKPPPPPQPLRTFLNLNAAPDPAYRYDPNRPPMQPYVPTRGQLRAQAGLMTLADLVRGLTIGATDEKDTNAAQIGELIQTGAPLLSVLKAPAAAAALMRGWLKIVKGAETAEEAAQAARTGIRAYHGSPHDFDKFDLSKIGTGEGAQAYGHGLYFAEKEGTAKVYRDALGGDAIHFPDGTQRVFERGTPEWIAQNNLNTFAASPDVDPYRAATSWIRKEIDQGLGRNTGRYEQNQRALEVLREWEAAGAKPGAAGRMYEVDINANPEHFIDWDKPLDEQPEHIREALTRAGVPSPPEVSVYKEPTGIWRVKAGGTYYGGFTSQEEAERKAFTLVKQSQQSGAEAYQRLRAKIAGEYPGATKGHAPPPGFDSWAMASERLKQEGIPGIKYLDAGSRDVGEGTRNYSVFDDALIEIRRKYGWLLPMMGLGALTQIDRKAVEQRPQ